jgi:hypothetical protein
VTLVKIVQGILNYLAPTAGNLRLLRLLPKAFTEGGWGGMMCLVLDGPWFAAGVLSITRGAVSTDLGDGAPNAPSQRNARVPKRGTAGKSSLKGRK